MPDRQNERVTTLYNVIFPLWLLWLVPRTWFVVIPANLVIDFLVVLLAMRTLGVPGPARSAATVLPRVFLAGFTADFIGTGLMFLANTLDFEGALGKWWYDSIASPVSYRPFSSLPAVLWVAVCVAVAGLCIYLFNKKFCLRRAALDDAQRKKIALALALCTAPYLFFLPTSWFY